jgi:sterol desaturase/sphingolipid hydroxylase (fatty acid hydroxylase superfamily)
MTLLNANFGIFVFLPYGFFYMIFVILLEASIVIYCLAPRPEEPNPKIYKSVFLANFTSGIMGIILLLIYSGGWNLWLNKHGAQIDSTQTLLLFIEYYLIAFILSLVIESWVNTQYLKTIAERRTIVRATLIANITSYVIGNLILYSYSFR